MTNIVGGGHAVLVALESRPKSNNIAMPVRSDVVTTIGLREGGVCGRHERTNLCEARDRGGQENYNGESFWLAHGSLGGPNLEAQFFGHSSVLVGVLKRVGHVARQMDAGSGS
jgi:hypothetical protein